MSTNKILTGGGFEKIPFITQNQNGSKVKLYYLQDPTQEKIEKAKAALLKVKKKHKIYDVDFEKFEEKIKKNPYLLRHGKSLNLPKEKQHKPLTRQ